jgi:hypothetical protein
MISAAPLTTPARGPIKREVTMYPPPPNGKCWMIFV